MGSSIKQSCTTRLLCCIKKWSILTESRVAVLILRMTRQTRTRATHCDESTAQEEQQEKISHRLFRQNHASQIRSPRLDRNVVFTSLQRRKPKCVYALLTGISVVAFASEERLKVVLRCRSVIGYRASTKMKKCNPFRELMMSPGIKNTFQWTG